MKLIIEISEQIYKQSCILADIDGSPILKAIKDGISLPKGHGRLGDLDKIKKKMQYYHDDCAKTSEYTRLGFETAIAVVENAKPIIEADKAESEG